MGGQGCHPRSPRRPRTVSPAERDRRSVRGGGRRQSTGSRRLGQAPRPLSRPVQQAVALLLDLGE
jgi:hypothetical protein